MRAMGWTLWEYGRHPWLFNRKLYHFILTHEALQGAKRQ